MTPDVKGVVGFGVAVIDSSLRLLLVGKNRCSCRHKVARTTKPQTHPFSILLRMLQSLPSLTMKDSPSSTPVAAFLSPANNGFHRQMQPALPPPPRPLRAILTGRQPFSNQQQQRSSNSNSSRSSSSSCAASRERILHYLEEALRILDDDDEEDLFGEAEDEEEEQGMMNRNPPSPPQDPPSRPPTSPGPSNQEP
jgi:hypothetical protein